MTSARMKVTAKRFGNVVEADLCPACLGRGAKQVEDELMPGGRSQQVRDLRGFERHQARQRDMKPSDIWPCVTCGGEGYR